MLPDPLLETRLRRDGLIALGQPWVPLVGGQTNHLWRVGAIVVKRFAPDDGNPRFPNDPEQEAAMLRYLERHAIAPRLLGHFALNGSVYLLYQHLQGTPWKADAAQVGRMLRRLHAISPPSGLRVLSGGAAAICEQVDQILPKLPDNLGRVLAQKRPVGVVPPVTHGVLLHGDVVPGNIVQAQDGVKLIDWQCPAQGDPVEDLAIFLSPAMQRIYRGQPLAPAERQAFLTAYGDQSVLQRLHQMKPWHHWAMAAYCAWKSVRGAADYAEAMSLELDAL